MKHLIEMALPRKSAPPENETETALHAGTEVRSDFSIHDICLASDFEDGVSFDGNIVRISESLCASLADGDVKSVLVTYLVMGPYGYAIPKTAIFNLSMTKDGPVISSHIPREPLLSNGAVSFNLLSDYAA